MAELARAAGTGQHQVQASTSCGSRATRKDQEAMEGQVRQRSHNECKVAHGSQHDGQSVRSGFPEATTGI